MFRKSRYLTITGEIKIITCKTAACSCSVDNIACSNTESGVSLYAWDGRAEFNCNMYPGAEPFSRI